MRILFLIIAMALFLPSMVAQQKEEKIYVMFRLDRDTLEMDFQNNRARLSKIVSLLQKAQQDSSIQLLKLELTGSASPEGGIAYNTRLAQARLDALETYLRSQITLPEDILVRTNHHVPYDYLAEMVENSDLQYRSEVLRIIREVPVAVYKKGVLVDSKRKHLMDFNYGRTWNVMSERFFPLMRNACALIITYQQKVAPKPLNIVKNFSISEPNFTLNQFSVANSEKKAFAEEPRKTILALKSNLLFDLLSIINYSVEVPINRKFSVLAFHQFSWWRFGKAKNEFCLRYVGVGCEGRWWFRPQPRPATENRVERDRLIGHFGGVYIETGLWDYEFKRNVCHQGEFWTTGLTYGCSMPIGRRLNLELSLSAGYASIPYRGYTPSKDYEILWRNVDEQGRWDYFGITKAQVSLVLPIKAKIRKGGDR